MPKTEVVFFREEDGFAPVLTWLEAINNDKAVAKCLVRIERLKAEGFSLRRPEADFLRDGIYELRIGLNGTNYRLLYFFHDRVAAVISHGIVKERMVPPIEIDQAIERMNRFKSDPERYTYNGE